MSTFNNLPLQDMIRSVVSNATEKLASDQNAAAQVRAAVTGAPAVKAAPEAQNEATDPDYVEKLASACDFIAGNVENIASPNRGVLGQALAKMAGEPMAPAVVTPDQLAVEAATGGEQKYKHDKPKGPDAAASTAGTPEGTAGLPGGATQMQNDMDSAPGGNNSSVPTAGYPEAGVLHAGSSKTAGLAALVASMDKEAGIGSALKGAAKKLDGAHLAMGSRMGLKSDAARRVASYGLSTAGGAAGGAATAGKGNRLKGAIAGGATGGAGLGFIGGAAAGLGTRAFKSEKTAGDIAREAILRKMAGEDVMQASISGSKGNGGALVGDGELQVMDGTQTTGNPTDGSGYGNQQRTHIGSNEAAMNYTKADAKKPRVPELKEVLDTPAFDASADSKLREQLRNAGSAGVKIAGAKSRELLKQAAAEGFLTQETVNRFRMTKQAQMGASAPPPSATGGMTAMAGEPSQNPKVQNLKSMMMSQKKTSMGDDNSPMSGGM